MLHSNHMVSSLVAIATMLGGFGSPADSENIIPNGDFSQGNVGFTSALPYVEPTYNCLWPSGYTIAPRFNRPQLHTLVLLEPFSSAQVRTGKEQVFYANAGGVDPLTVWQTDVECKPKTQYQISFFCASLSGREDNGTPPREVPSAEWQPSFEIVANKDVSPEYMAGLGKFYKVTMTWNSGRSKTATIKIVRARIEHGGGLIAISNITMVPTRKAVDSTATTTEAGN